jgi:hypothetical protein
VLKTHNQYPVDVVNVSSRDLKYFSRLLTKSEFNKQVEGLPVLKRLVAANTVSESPDLVAPQAYTVREVAARTSGGAAKTARVAFIGLTSVSPSVVQGFKVVDPIEAAKRVVPEAKKTADVIVVLAHLSVTDAARLAREVPGIDVIASSGAQSGDSFFAPPFTVGGTFVVFTPYETRMIGELRFYRDEQGRFSSRARFISLDETVPDDPVALKPVVAAKRAEDDAYAMSKSLLNEWLAKSAPANQVNASTGNSAGGDSGFVSSGKCAECHMKQYVQWANTGHAHTADKLVNRLGEFEISCLNCHATGQPKAGAQQVGVVARFQSVQCEQCHGPGGDHVAKPAKGYGRIANAPLLCATCHTAKTSPNFNFQAAWAKIKH